MKIKKIICLTLILVMMLSVISCSVSSFSALTPLEPKKQVEYNFKNFYSEKTDGEVPYYVTCYELSDFPKYNDSNNYDYFLVRFDSLDVFETSYLHYFGYNEEFYEMCYSTNKVFESGLAVFVGYVYDDEYKNSFYSLEEIAKTTPEAVECIENVVGSSSVGVIYGDECYKPQVDELDRLCWKANNTFGACAGNYFHDPGSVFLTINNLNDISSALKEASDLIELTDYYYYVFKSNGVTQLQIQSAYDKLNSVMKAATVKEYEVEFLLDYCLDENNNDGYYPSELWAEFNDSLLNAQSVLDNDNATNDEYNRAYWDLLYNYNMLCSVNPVMHDVNFDGEVNILDATQYQLILANRLSSNSSIRYITNFDSTCATKIQRRLVGLDLNRPLYGSTVLKSLVDSREKFNLDCEEWDFSAWIINECYYLNRCAGHC